MYKGVLIFLLSALIMFHCSKVENYFSGQKHDITIKKSEQPVINITGTAFDSGRLMVFYNDSADSEKSFLYQESTNKGFSWSKPENVFKNKEEIRNPFVTKLSDQSLILVFNEMSDNLNSYGSFYLVRSYDYGKTFTVPRMIAVSEYNELTITSGIVQMGKSRLFLPVKAKDKEKQECNLLLFSPDKGRTWEKVFNITSDLNSDQFSIPVVINLKNGFLNCLLEHENGYIYSTFSDDTGRTWTKPERTNIYGKAVSPLLSDNGNLICLYEDQTPEGISMMKSYDLGKTWEVETQCIQGNNIVINPYFLSIDSSNALILYSRSNLMSDKGKTQWQIQCKLFKIEWIKQPKAVAASSHSNGIRLRWNKVNNASYYIVYRSSLPDSISGPEYRIARTKLNNYVDKTVTNSGKYYYSVSAVEGYGKLISDTGNESDLSDPVIVEYNLKIN